MRVDRCPATMRRSLERAPAPDERIDAMPLPSQMPRTNRQVSLRNGSGGRTSGGIRAIALAGVCVAAGTLVWWRFGFSESEPASSHPGPQASVTPSSEAAAIKLGRAAPMTGTLATEHRTVLATDRQPVNPATRAAPTGGAGVASPVSTLSQSTSPGAIETEPGAPKADSAGDAQTHQAAPARDAAVQRLIASGETALAGTRLLEARNNFNRALHHPRATASDTAWLRQQLSAINATLVFSTAVTPSDPMVSTHVVQPGDRLAVIARTQDVATDWRFIQRVNQMSDPGRLRVGQKLKVVKGPFHAVVFKSSYRLDLYSEATDSDGNRLYIRSFNVGLGEHNSTPTGRWTVRPASKLVNPPWVNPRTGERFGADDPKNPIGEFWIGIQGADPQTEVLSGYGIHGTIEPESIGTDASMGCVRLQSADIAMLYELLVETRSQVEILP